MTSIEIEELAHYLTMDLVDTINKEAADAELDVAINVLSMYIGHLVYRALENKPTDDEAEGMDRAEKEEYAFQSYKNMKENIQNAVATGFKGALETFSGKYCDYYCQVLPVPNPVNTRPC